MAVSNCCPGANLAAHAAVSPAPPNPPAQFPDNQWVRVLDWSGGTVQTLAYAVSVSPATAVVKWRRQNQLSGPVSEGSFQGEIDLTIRPTDTKLAIDLWVDDPNVTITIVFSGAVP